MEFAFPWPLSQGEWLAFLSAAVTIGFGLLLLLLPRWSLHLLRLRPAVPVAIAQARGTMAGFYLGLGVCCILLAQPLLYLALGASWAATAFGRALAMVLDRASTPSNWIALPIELALAAAPLAFALGYLA